MKIKKKGKVHPSPPPPSLSDDVSSVFHLLPAAILALVTLLSADDRHVLAYMITRSMKTAPSSSSSSSKLTSNNNDKKSRRHVFGCDCFDCYRSYWFRWDSSPNRELIHQAIEAFENHVAAKPSRKAKTSRRRQAQKSPETEEEQVFVAAPPEEVLNVEVSSVSEVGRVEEEEEELRVEEEVKEEGALSVRAAAAGNSYKGFARKVLPDVLGLFNSRLWKLWSPNA